MIGSLTSSQSTSLKIEILTLFPEIFDSFLSCSLIKKAQDKSLLTISRTNIRDFAPLPHRHVDDTPYGGGAGMVMKVEPLHDAITAAKTKLPNAMVILMSPRGAPFTQATARRLSENSELIFVCGRYEGVDERIVELCIDEEISMGDFVLMGGEIPAMAVIEATARCIPGILGNPDSAETESFSEDALLEAPQYTRPPEYLGKKVPDVLLAGNHAEIKKWRAAQSQQITKQRRPDIAKS